MACLQVVDEGDRFHIWRKLTAITNFVVPYSEGNFFTNWATVNFCRRNLFHQFAYEQRVTQKLTFLRIISSPADIIIIIIIIIIIVIIILVITFMRGMYCYIPETNHLSWVYSVAALLYLKFVLHVMLFRLWNMVCTFTLALPLAYEQCPVRLFFSVP